MKIIYVFLGSLFCLIGLVGVALPLLPTTPFLLLSVACYARGSKTLYKILTENKFVGEYIKNYKEGRGVPKRIKILVISMLLLSISYGVIFFKISLLVKVILVSIAIGVTIHIVHLKTYLTENKKGL